ncbi:tail fiber protein [Klebsiella phage KPV811]|uniref:Tail fibers protein n=1 Tax=Klebsiella phage KPV811 TaxID=1913574 RepID=A0A1J0MI03_9CAUD|nr:tail fiber protein [Klebsiella phage KPV811]APD20665.1 tail fibers protein [Klebsiella phage KPV811]
MAYSWQEQIKPAGTQDIQCDIEYLDKSYIHVYLDGVETTGYTWTSATNIRLNSALTASTTVLLIRKTEREYLYIEFASGSPFIEGNVDSQNTQFLHLAQELVEGRAIPGFYGNISMNGYRITNVADPINLQDAATKGYVDAGDARLNARIDSEHAAWVSAVQVEATTRKVADDALSMRTSALENTFISGVETVSYPWSTVLTEETDEVTPGLKFTKAVVEINGVGQIRGYSFEIVDNTILFAETLPAGTVVAARLGADVTAGDGFATQASVDHLAHSLGDLAYLGKAEAVTDATGAEDVVNQLNALLAALRTSGVLAS